MEIATVLNLLITILVVVLAALWRSMNNGFLRMESHFNSRFDRVDARLDDLNTRLSRVEGALSTREFTVYEPRKIKGE